MILLYANTRRRRWAAANTKLWCENGSLRFWFQWKRRWGESICERVNQRMNPFYTVNSIVTTPLWRHFFLSLSTLFLSFYKFLGVFNSLSDSKIFIIIIINKYFYYFLLKREISFGYLIGSRVTKFLKLLFFSSTSSVSCDCFFHIIV